MTIKVEIVHNDAKREKMLYFTSTSDKRDELNDLDEILRTIMTGQQRDAGYVASNVLRIAIKLPQEE